jgi:hypothetical protein
MDVHPPSMEESKEDEETSLKSSMAVIDTIVIWQNIFENLREWVHALKLCQGKQLYEEIINLNKLANKLLKYLADECGADLHMETSHGISILHRAAQDDNYYLVTYLRDAKAFDMM